MSEESVTRVVVTDVQMPFWSMVRFMVKWAIAAIPAMVILAVVAFIFAFLFGALTGSLGGVWRQASSPSYHEESLVVQTSPAIKKAPETNVPQFAQRCIGNPDVEKCIDDERKLAAETSEQRKARQEQLEADRRANMAKVH